MGQEIELKLGIQREDVDRLVHHPFLKKCSAGSPATKHLINYYYDTPGQDLRAHGMALRIRFDGEHYIQTLKTRGKGIKGLKVRGEWEWRVDGFQIELNRMPPDVCPPDLRAKLDRLTPVFQTDFERMAWLLRIPAEEQFNIQVSASVEMALDQGEVVTHTEKGRVCDAILEMELELQEGDPEVLFRISDLLGRDIHLVASDISKARRGYRLLGGYH